MNNMTYKIRRPTAKDAKIVRKMSGDLERAMAALFKNQGMPDFAKEPAIEARFSTKTHAKWFAGITGKDIDLDHLWCVLEVDGNVGGYIYAKVVEKNSKGHLDSLYILKEYRGNGYAIELVKHVIKWFKSKKVRFVDISVDAPNHPAKKLYEKLGFVCTSYHYNKKLS
jgi:ribosomal protein S18 acetylase RimI-like enzyme